MLNKIAAESYTCMDEDKPCVVKKIPFMAAE